MDNVSRTINVYRRYSVKAICTNGTDNSKSIILRIRSRRGVIKSTERRKFRRETGHKHFVIFRFL